MARTEKLFQVSLNASEGGRRDSAISVNDPTVNPDDVYANRLKFIYNQGPSPDLQQQDALARLQNQDVSPLLNVDMSGVPSTAPFPLGCPAGMYQQGNTCIPMIGTYPDPTSNAPPAGNDLPKGVLQQVIAPQVTAAGQIFQIKAYFENIGGVRGKFFISVDIPDLGMTAQASTGVWIPAFSNGIIYKNIPMPMTVPSGTSFQATLNLQHLDERTGNFVSDDAEHFNIPSPGTVMSSNPPPPTDSPPPPVTTPPSTTCVQTQMCMQNAHWDTTQCKCVDNPVVDPHGCTEGTRWSDCHQACLPAGVAEPAPGDPSCVGYHPPDPVPTPIPAPIPGPNNNCPKDCPTGKHFSGCTCDCIADNVPEPECFRNCCEDTGGNDDGSGRENDDMNHPPGLHLGWGGLDHPPGLALGWYKNHGGLDIGNIGNDIHDFTNKLIGKTNDITGDATLILSHHDTAPDQDVNVVGTGFHPGEDVDIDTHITTHNPKNHHNRKQWEGKHFHKKHRKKADSHGKIRTSIHIPALPSGVNGAAIIALSGLQSGKQRSDSVGIDN